MNSNDTGCKERRFMLLVRKLRVGLKSFPVFISRPSPWTDICEFKGHLSTALQIVEIVESN